MNITRAEVQQVLDAMETASNGLEWYRDAFPEVVNGSDDEANSQIEAAISLLQSKLAEKDDVEPVAWLYWNKVNKEYRVCQLSEHDAEDFPVFTHPAPKPMTEKK